MAFPADPSPAASSSEPGVVTLASIPAEVDAAWWRRHAHLVHGENGRLRFEPGAPCEVPEPCAEAPAPAGEAFQGLRGQAVRIARLERTIKGCRILGKTLPHVLFSGRAGMGKTTLARGYATAARRPLVEVAAPMLGDRSDLLVRLLAGLREGSVLFLDEAHALPRPLLEILRQVLSEPRLSLLLSDGGLLRCVTLRLSAFTIVVATTDEGAIPPALRCRFGLREALLPHDEEVPAEIVRTEAVSRGVETTPEDAAADGATSPRRVDAGLDLPAAALAHLGYDADDLDPTEQRHVGHGAPRLAGPIPPSRLARTSTVPGVPVRPASRAWAAARRTFGRRSRWRSRAPDGR